MKVAGGVFDEKPAAGAALPCGAGDLGDKHADLITGFVALNGSVAAVFNEPVEGLKKRMPLLVRNEVCLVGEVVRAVVHDFAAVALDFHGNVIGGFCRSVSIRCRKRRQGVKNGIAEGFFLD